MIHKGIFLLILCAHFGRGKVEELDEWISDGEPKRIVSVSGFSAGGNIAIQLYLAHSSIMKGVAVFSGLLYQCGEGPEPEVLKLIQCSSGHTNLTRTTEKIRKLSQKKLLDPLENLKNGRHYIEQGRFDYIVRPRASKIILSFFEQYSEHVKYVLLPHTHAAPTEKCGSSCSLRVTPFSGYVNCGYSAAYEGLNYIYDGKLRHPRHSKMARCHLRDDEIPGLIEFSQKEFFPPGHQKVGMADTGYIYIPETCRQRSSNCSLHLHFHGCLNDAMMHGKSYIKNSELLAIAERNNMIAIFPFHNYHQTIVNV